MKNVSRSEKFSSGSYRGKITLLRGVPGSGKSTYANKLAKNDEKVVVFSTDDFFTHFNQDTKQYEYQFDVAKKL